MCECTYAISFSEQIKNSVFNAIVVSKILYALPVYFGIGYLTQGHKEMLQRVFKRAYRRGFTLFEHMTLRRWLRTLSSTYFVLVVLKVTVLIIYTLQTRNLQVPCN